MSQTDHSLFEALCCRMPNHVEFEDTQYGRAQVITLSACGTEERFAIGG